MSILLLKNDNKLNEFVSKNRQLAVLESDNENIDKHMLGRHSKE